MEICGITEGHRYKVMNLKPRIPKISKCCSEVCLVCALLILSLHPWILYGLRGPSSDGVRLLYSAAGKFGLMPIGWEDLLLTGGVSVFIAPLLFVVRSPHFFWIGSFILAVTSCWGTYCFWVIFRQLLRYRLSVIIGVSLIAFHPFVHQMHYFWMTELGYLIFLFLGLYELSVYLVQRHLLTLIRASVYIFLSVLIRPQSTLVYPIAALAILLSYVPTMLANPKVQIYRCLGQISMFLGVGVLLSLPIRYLNHIHHNTWQFSKYLGKAVTMYLHGGYDRTAGPNSEKLSELSSIILKNPRWVEIGRSPVTCGDRVGTSDLTFLNVPSLQSLPVWSKDPCAHPFWYWLYQKTYLDSVRILGPGHDVSNNGPSAIYYAFTNDWQKSDDFAVQVWIEAIRQHPFGYLQWGLHWAKGYFTWLSENPNEWHNGFATHYMQGDHADLERAAIPLYKQTIEGGRLGGLAFVYPKLVDIYSLLRSIFAFVMTYSKKVTIVLLPFLLFIVFRRGPPVLFWFLFLSSLTQIASGVAMGMLVGFHHRYAVPLEFFTIFYLGCWLDIFLDFLPANTWVRSLRLNPR